MREELLPRTRKLVAVADPRGRVVLATAEEDSARERAENVGLAEGVVSTNLTRGVNGIGRTVRDRRANQCLAATHWRVDQVGLVCDVVPVWYRKRLVAAINITDEAKAATDETLAMLEFFAGRVEDELARADRDGRARRCAARQLLDRCGTPAFVITDGTVIAGRDMHLEPGDPVGFRNPPSPGVHWHPRLGFVLFEPLPEADSWLVRSVSSGDEPTIRIIFDFEAHNPVVRMRGTIVEYDYPISRARYVDVLTALCRNRAGLDTRGLSSALYGEPGRSSNVRSLMSRLRDEIWWLVGPGEGLDRGYRLATQLDIELLSPR